MPHDHRGRELADGDLALIRVRVVRVEEGGQACHVRVQVVPPSETEDLVYLPEFDVHGSLVLADEPAPKVGRRSTKPADSPAPSDPAT